MTEAELVESATSYFDIALTSLTIYITACSGYLIAAYLVGRHLTKSQNFIVSTLFCFVATVTTYAFYAWMERAFGFLYVQISLPTAIDNREPVTWLSHFLTAALVSGIAACLKFMWDVRHPKE
jgi:hypothetical protein